MLKYILRVAHESGDQYFEFKTAKERDGNKRLFDAGGIENESYDVAVSK